MPYVRMCVEMFIYMPKKLWHGLNLLDVVEICADLNTERNGGDVERD